MSVSAPMNDPVALIAVVGPASHDLLEPFAAHYSSLGVTEWRVAVHFPAGTSTGDRTRLLTACRNAVGPPELISEGEWRVPTNPTLRDRLRARARAEWHVLADSDEFQFHPGGIHETIARCRADGGAARHQFATGLFVDRLSANGDASPGASTPTGLDTCFPLGSFLTAEILHADPRKVTIAHRDVEIGSGGNHFVWDDPIEAPAPMPVHHFKWRAGVHEYLEHRIRTFEDRTEPREHMVRAEAERALRFLSRPEANGHDGLVRFPASLDELPADWWTISAAVWRRWQVERRFTEGG